MNARRPVEEAPRSAAEPPAVRPVAPGEGPEPEPDPAHLHEGEERQIRGRALVLLRHYRGYTQSRLAEISGVNKATISACERGLQEIGETKRRRLLRALRLPSRAWEATVRHVEWLDWLAERGPQGTQGEPGGLPGDLLDEDLDGLRREVERIAEAAGRDRERQVGTLLELFTHLLS